MKNNIYLVEALNVEPILTKESRAELIQKPIDNCIENIKKASILAPDSIMTNIEGIHESATRNYTRYMPEALKDSVPYWTSPYNVPLILHHNEKNGVIVGRVFGATYVRESEVNPKVGALQFLCNVSDTNAIKGVKDGRFNTVSIGVIATDIRCSICGEPIELDEDGESTCGHTRGCEYDGEICYWDIYKMQPKELSYVIVPSDSYAQTLDIKSLKSYESKNEGVDRSEGLAEKKGEIEMPKEATKAVIEEDKTAKAAPSAEDKGLDVQLQEKVEELADVNKQLKESQDKNSELSENINQLTKELNEAKTEIQNLNIEIKENTVDKIIDLRAKLNKSVIAKEELLKRSYGSLSDSLLDLQEDLKATIIAKPENKTITSKDKFNNIKEDKTSISTVSEITLVESKSLVKPDKTNVNLTEKKIEVDSNNISEDNQCTSIDDLINYL